MTTAIAPPLDDARTYWLTAPNVADTPRLARNPTMITTQHRP
jgi:hypothetical protein